MPPDGDVYKLVVHPATKALVDITPHLLSWKLYGAMLIYFIVQGINIGAYSARLAGVQTHRIATSISLFNLFVMVSRLSTLFSIVLIAPLSDAAGDALHAIGSTDPAAKLAFTHNYEVQLRLMVLAGTFGMLVFALLLPALTYTFRRGIASFEARHSVLHGLVRLLDPRVVVDILSQCRLPRASELRAFSTRNLPKRLLIFNVVVTAVYAIGVPASYLASVIDIDAARTAVSLSGIINGLGTIAFTLFVDPTSALITDQAVKAQRPIEDVRSMVFYLALTAIVGTLVSQLIFYPSAAIIAAAAHFFTHLRG